MRIALIALTPECVNGRNNNNNNKEVEFIWVPSHIHLYGNDKADWAVKLGLKYTSIQLDYSTHELYSQVRTTVSEKGTTNNNLTEKEQRIINRLMLRKTLLQTSFGKHRIDKEKTKAAHTAKKPKLWSALSTTIITIYNTEQTSNSISKG
ncbi:hypothetical protein CHS0354_025551 [Potamilus streckersoni]|uniref:RNase H type-1 domain-containing protein n=1 Tax=Potamilus streckersoni TaxID=2493646 RepID=A0AAE0S1L7_9BIVA|nr:hypothetical protein CHS0354_025551 [Potamilus streckersoni]